jgi:benzylsuccinate CoA-transferase BbsF subunit
MNLEEVMKGIKVADFSWVGVGPMVARELAEHGATVIRVESHRNPDSLRLAFPFKDGVPGINRSAFGAFANTNKFSMSVDLNTEKGREVAIRLIKWADIVTESFTPGVMAKYGLDYESVKKIKPDIIYYSTNQLGQWGPYAKIPGYGIQGAAGAGFCYITGWPDRDPVMVHGAYTDFISPWYLLVPLIGALIRKRKTGDGMYLDQSQYESSIHFLEPAILDYTVNGRVATRMGNRCPYAAPHNAYPCKGKDRWIAIAVHKEEEWESLCKIMGRPELARDPKFENIQARKENEEELDSLISDWTRNYFPRELMYLLQMGGVPAGVVCNSLDLFDDPQLNHRRHYVRLTHTEIGPMAFRAPAYRLSKSPSRLIRGAPCLGEHNDFVYREILGYSDDEISEMLAEGVITTEYDAPSVVRPR